MVLEQCLGSKDSALGAQIELAHEGQHLHILSICILLKPQPGSRLVSFESQMCQPRERIILFIKLLVYLFWLRKGVWDVCLAELLPMTRRNDLCTRD